MQELKNTALKIYRQNTRSQIIHIGRGLKRLLPHMRDKRVECLT